MTRKSRTLPRANTSDAMLNNGLEHDSIPMDTLGGVEEEDLLHNPIENELDDESIYSESNRTKRWWWPFKSKGEEYVSRRFHLGEQPAGFAPNVVRNQKYTLLSFLPVVNDYYFISKVLYEQFKFFFNLYFLLVALSQLVKALQVGKKYSILL